MQKIPLNDLIYQRSNYESLWNKSLNYPMYFESINICSTKYFLKFILFVLTQKSDRIIAWDIFMKRSLNGFYFLHLWTKLLRVDQCQKNASTVAHQATGDYLYAQNSNFLLKYKRVCIHQLVAFVVDIDLIYLWIRCMQ